MLPSSPLAGPPSTLTATPSQIEWDAQIKPLVEAEFDRVAHTLRQVAVRQRREDRLDTLAILAILEEKRVETLAAGSAGYLLRLWREMSDRVRNLLNQDSRFQAIEAARRARKSKAVSC